MRLPTCSHPPAPKGRKTTAQGLPADLSAKVLSKAGASAQAGNALGRRSIRVCQALKGRKKASCRRDGEQQALVS